MKHNRTPWFDGSIKPARPGVYQVRRSDRTVAFCKWGGSAWGRHHDSAAAAAVRDAGWTPFHRPLRWRGLPTPAPLPRRSSLAAPFERFV